MITVDNKKMSKSEGNFFTLRDIAQEYDLEVVRLFLLSAHYRSPINFSRDVMDQMENALERLYNSKKNLEYLMEKTEERDLSSADKTHLDRIKGYKDDFENSMKDDLEQLMPWPLFELVKYSNTEFDEKANKKLVTKAYETLMDLTKVLGILTKEEELLEEEILDLIEQRTLARKNKDYQKADEIRDLLKEKGIILEDTQEGVKWKRV